MDRKRQNKRIAVALQYDETTDDAPRVSVSGERKFAETIAKVARRYGIPVTTDGEIAAKLLAVQDEGEVPLELYHEVARILKNSSKKPHF